MEASDLGQTTDPPAFAIVVTIVKTSHIVAEYNIASGSIATESKQIANAMQTKRQMKTGAVIEDVVPSLTDTRITVNDNEDVKMRDEGSSRLSSVVGDKSRLDDLSKTISSFLFLLIMNVVDLNCTVLGVTQQESGRCLSR